MIEDGAVVLRRATDRLGNRREVDASWLVDVAPPKAWIVGPGGERPGEGEALILSPGQAVELSVEDAGVVLERATYRINRSRALAVPELLRPAFVGRALLTLEARDLMGNTSSSSWYLVVARPGRGD